MDRTAAGTSHEETLKRSGSPAIFVRSWLPGVSPAP